MKFYEFTVKYYLEELAKVKHCEGFDGLALMGSMHCHMINEIANQIDILREETDELKHQIKLLNKRLGYD